MLIHRPEVGFEGSHDLCGGVAVLLLIRTGSGLQSEAQDPAAERVQQAQLSAVCELHVEEIKEGSFEPFEAFYNDGCECSEMTLMKGRHCRLLQHGDKMPDNITGSLRVFHA